MVCIQNLEKNPFQSKTSLTSLPFPKPRHSTFGNYSYLNVVISLLKGEKDKHKKKMQRTIDACVIVIKLIQKFQNDCGILCVSFITFNLCACMIKIV